MQQNPFSPFPSWTLFNIPSMYFGATILAPQSIYIDIDDQYSGFA
jgi:hypothetical protein